MKPLPLLLALALAGSVIGNALSQELNVHASASKEALTVHIKNMLFCAFGSEHRSRRNSHVRE